MAPNIFAQPIFNIFRSREKYLHDDQTDADAALLADEVNDLLDNSITAEVNRSEEMLDDASAAPALQRSNSYAASFISTIASPLAKPLGFKSRWSDRIRRHGQPIQVVTGSLADAHERGRK